MNDVVITGYGLVTPFGMGVDPFWHGLLAGDRALGPAQRFRHAEEPVGEIRTPTPSDKPRKQAFTEAAIAEAVRDAGLARIPDDALVVLVGQAPWCDGGKESDPDWSEFVGPVSVADIASSRAVYLTHACASAAFGVAFARSAIQAGIVDTAVVAGASVLNRYEYASMRVVKAISPHPARPFDRDRSGISLGEGAGALIIERREHAHARGARDDLAVLGAACQVVAASSAASDEAAITECLRAAIADARVDRLDYVHAHATGTPRGDAVELAALETLAADLDLTGLPVGSHKGAIGHLLHASALPAIVAAALVLRTGVVPPTAGLANPEPCRRLHLGPARLASAATTVAAVTSFGFGGNSCTLVLGRVAS